jgi:hypothetical protein
MRSDLISREVLLSEYDNNFVRYKDFRDFLENVPDVEIRDSLFVNGYAQGYEKAKKEYERPQGEQIAWEQGYECGKNEKRSQGEWIYDYRTCTCSVCNFTTVIDTYNFCPNCGADMRGGVGAKVENIPMLDEIVMPVKPDEAVQRKLEGYREGSKCEDCADKYVCKFSALRKRGEE